MAFGNGGFAEYVRMQADFVYVLHPGLPNEYLYFSSSSFSLSFQLFLPPSTSQNSVFERVIDTQHPLCVRGRPSGQL